VPKAQHGTHWAGRLFSPTEVPSALVTMSLKVKPLLSSLGLQLSAHLCLRFLRSEVLGSDLIQSCYDFFLVLIQCRCSIGHTIKTYFKE
jgi:hypothetical protein